MPFDDVLETAHKHCAEHRKDVLQSNVCGCFHCGKTFTPDSIVEWIDNDQTALCPFCTIDSVIGSKSGYEMKPDFLRAMHDYWFSDS